MGQANHDPAHPGHHVEADFGYRQNRRVRYRQRTGKGAEKIGFLTGSTALYQRLTPEEIVKYYADLHGMDKEIFKREKSNFSLCWVSMSLPNAGSENYLPV